MKGVNVIQTSIVKWGNSQGIRLPKTLLSSANLADNDIVEIIAENNMLVIRKVENKKTHKTIQERFENFNGEYTFEEWDTGKPVGGEVF